MHAASQSWKACGRYYEIRLLFTISCISLHHRCHDRALLTMTQHDVGNSPSRLHSPTHNTNVLYDTIIAFLDCTLPGAIVCSCQQYTSQKTWIMSSRAGPVPTHWTARTEGRKKTHSDTTRGTPLLWTPWGPGEVSRIERCPHFWGKFILKKHTWDTAKCL